MTRPPVDLNSALADARQRVQAPAMPQVAPLLALATSPTLHRLLGPRIAAWVAEAHGLLMWHTRADVRERARASMDAIVGGTERAHEATALARRFVLEKHVQRMLFWQPPTHARMDERSRANLDAALSGARGVVLSACHLGPFFDVTTPIVARGRRSFLIAGGWFFDPPTRDFAGRRLAHWWHRTEARENHLVRVEGSSPVIQTLLEDGEIVVIFFDVFGSRETVLLGKPMWLASGTARLAIAANALVLPVRSRRVAGRVWLDISPALDPSDFTEPGELHDALASIHSQLILEYAETLEDPRRAGAWEDGATAQAWIAPYQQAQRESPTA